MEQDPSALVIPFGKHQGLTVAELLAKDPAYADWLAAQGWLAQRFAELHAAIVTRGAGADDSPEHNRIQVRFLDPLVRAAFVSLTQNVHEARIRDWHDRTAYLRDNLREAQQNLERAQANLDYANKQLSDPFYGKPQYRQQRLHDIAKAEQKLQSAQDMLPNAQAALANFPHLPLSSTVRFEQSGVDALIEWAFLEVIPNRYDRRYRSIAVEIKPAMGDDYPSVMRQMQRLQCTCLLIETYSGQAVPLPVLRQMFAANQQTILTLQDIEAEFPNARKLLENPQT